MNRNTEYCPCGFEPMNGRELRQHAYHCDKHSMYHVAPKSRQEWVMITKEVYDKYKHMLEPHKRYATGDNIE